ncbi:hypothetical protein BK643_13985 [Pseudomonas protegens]|uniref:hypothetical protein n=1 Tax=Pseudomonas protegens TaxID=380021 RepID=UPI000F46B4F4|nr:hypothetical protein [Pseudomonas protegens]ROM16902.1 hypothetical protein BK643_13985 [Pseudomonas protegens]
MEIPSPFDGLHLNRELTCEFFAVFSRFEFALKESGFVREGRGSIEPAWRRYAEDVAKLLIVERGSLLDKSINYLCAEPPLFQVGAQRWEHRALHGNSKLEQAIDAAKQVRNNLFHGGKHTPHSPPGRDNKLVKSSLVVLYACLTADEKTRDVYIQNQF